MPKGSTSARWPPLFCRPLQLTGRTKRCLNLGSYNYLGFAAQVGGAGVHNQLLLPWLLASLHLSLGMPKHCPVGCSGCAAQHLSFALLYAPQDPYCTPRVEEALDQLGWASASARADAGTTPRHVELERLVAEFLVRSAAAWVLSEECNLLALMRVPCVPQAGWY